MRGEGEMSYEGIAFQSSLWSVSSRYGHRQFDGFQVSSLFESELYGVYEAIQGADRGP
jgi:hypothetical protein